MIARSRSTMPTLTVAALLLAAGCSKNGPAAQPDQLPVTPGFTLQSPILGEGQAVDRKLTCDGADVSPALSWPAPPAGTQSLALVMDDPDAPSGTFTHWLLWGLAADRRALPEGVEKSAEPAGVGRQGKNGFDKLGYNGPCPPAGKVHHYRFTLYALSSTLDVAAGAGRATLEPALAGKILAQSTLTGTYERK